MSHWAGMDVLANAALAAQRMNLRPPHVIATALRRLLQRALQARTGEPGIEDWRAPLIARSDAAAPFETPTAGRLDSPPGAQRPDAASGGARCLIVTSDLDAGGMDEVVVFLARRLPHHGLHTAVLHASSGGSADGSPSGRLGRSLRAEGVEVTELAVEIGSAWLRAWRPDVISAHGAPAWVLDLAHRLSIPYVETLHGMHSLFNADWIAEAERSRRLAAIVAVSDLVRHQYLTGNPKFPSQRVITVPNGVDDERRTFCDREAARAHLGLGDEFLFVSLARHCLQKNTYGLVAAFEDVAARHPQAHLAVAGRPDDAVYFTQLRRLRESLHCRDRIHLRDHTAQPAALLAAADGFVLDSFFEGWSLASMEALCAGIPVVLSEVGGAREQVGDGMRCGHVVPNPAGDPLQVNWQTMRHFGYRRQPNREALVEAMSSLVARRRHWQQQRRPLIDESKARFHPDVCLRRHAEVLSAAALGGGLPAPAMQREVAWR